MLIGYAIGVERGDSWEVGSVGGDLWEVEFTGSLEMEGVARKKSERGSL